MEINTDQLRSRYESLPTEDLLALLGEGGLTEDAEHVLRGVLRDLGAVDRNGVVVDEAAMAEAASSETNQRLASHPVDYFAVLAVVLPFVAFACFTYLAPFIWRSPADRFCQKHGCWYATKVRPTQVTCAGWQYTVH